MLGLLLADGAPTVGRGIWIWILIFGFKFWGQNCTFLSLAANWRLTGQCFQHEKLAFLVILGEALPSTLVLTDLELLELVVVVVDPGLE